MDEAQETRGTVTVYSKPSCVQCNATYRALEAKGISYTVVDLSRDDNALEYVKDLDPTYMQAPIVVVDEHDHWSGFRPDCIDRIAAAGVK
ncbi:glutaredoxin-like protein NrdH [Microbacterium imperiale]|uniref:glutaredoxin-like protein NrdH n=1 Tax=Microbacterium imperiale TaxID=33884 RepID=UPI001AE9A6A6|nr:glutaredoxin-like protein NrdH [Microbacterium imperiale]MBP2422211.1 glutaredoxin-like protein NrdH [Microbacterium imperiale]MDS0200692.1 glutaredoxin-like protein NrdH [Microbacterium imperiale]